MSTSKHAVPRPPSGAGLLLLVAALVVGVLGMHALSTVCGGMSDESAVAASPTMHQLVDDSSAEMVHDSDEGSPLDDVMSICLAALLAVGSLLVVLALRRSARGWRVARVRTPRMPSLAATARPRPPPSLARLSILRC